ncbi:DUF4411 family protein [Succinivibrio dextrinosolvens]|uniref:DUF4411 family protein n=1 Tax=Succinivibrio dextrinosolvens TaxID=83771 RepID=UPI00068E83B3|nr:DUF4411 family protein [Succinivibrio dextrinosolvens]
MSNIVYPKYLIDTNVLVQAHRLYYQFDFCNGFWNWILTLNDGGCLGIDKVYEEIIKNKDELANWIKNKKNLFLQFDSTSISYFKDIYSILNNNGVPQNKIYGTNTIRSLSQIC